MTAPLMVIRDATCLACGCLCDDIDLTVDAGRIASADRACEIGRGWFQADHSRHQRPIATINGQPASRDEAVAKAVAILRQARSPLILGLVQTGIETQREAVALADRLGATIDPGRTPGSLPRWQAVQRVGVVSATLGEVRDRADLIIFWGVDPVTNQPRHLERYSGEARGRFIPDGRDGRRIVVVDSEPSATAEIADLFIPIDTDRQTDVLSSLRSLIRGVDDFASYPHLKPLADLMKAARYGAFFYGGGLSAEGSGAVEEALRLVRDLNRHTRFVGLSMGEAGNAAGAEAVLSWQAGSPRAIDFSAGFPRFLPDIATSEARLNSGSADAAILVADDPTTWLSEEANRALGKIPTIAIAPSASDRSWAVALNSATTGIHAGGSVMRCDGATLPLRPALNSDLPSDLDWLRSLRDRLEAHS